MKLFSPVALGVVNSVTTPHWQFSYGPDAVLGGITGGAVETTDDCRSFRLNRSRHAHTS